MEFKFTPITKEPFPWDREYEDGTVQRIGVYHPGAVYNCTKEPRHDALREQCKIWKDKGMIAIIPLNPGEAFRTLQVAQASPDPDTEESS